MCSLGFEGGALHEVEARHESVVSHVQVVPEGKLEVEEELDPLVPHSLVEEARPVGDFGLLGHRPRKALFVGVLNTVHELLHRRA